MVALHKLLFNNEDVLLCQLQAKSFTILLTFGDHALQSDDVRVVKLAHNRRLAQKVPPLTLHIPSFQCLYRHGDLLLPRCSQATAAHLSELT